MEVSFDGIDEAIRTTRELTANPKIPAIYEGTFEHDGLLVRVDILQRRRNRRWGLIEVKSTTDLKEHHLEDVAIQSRVVSRSGLNLASVCLAHVSRDYVFDGRTIDARRFFRIRNLTHQVAKLRRKLTFQLRSEFRVLAMPEAPGLPPGNHCINPVTCEFYDQCNLPRPDDHVGFLPRIYPDTVEELAGRGVYA